MLSNACRPRLWMATVLMGLAAFGCGRRAESPISQRLSDLYKPELVMARAPLPSPPPRTEWRFDGPAPVPAPEKNVATRGWEAFNGVAGLAVRDGRLVGTASNDLPILHLERDVSRADPDLVHEIEVRLRVSAGANLGVSASGAEKADPDYVLDVGRHFDWEFTTPLVAGDELRTYTLRSRFALPASRTRHLFIRPSDVKGARFEIESVRMVFRKEHLAGVASGLSWQGLSEIYHETLVGRAPETIRFDVALTARPRLDLAVGTIEDAPITFRVNAKSNGAEALLLKRTVTRAHRWEDVRVDLTRFGGRSVRLLLSLASDRPGAVGFWGGPVVRSVGQAPRAAHGESAAPPPQGVILVWADTLRRDHTSVYGYHRPTTPHLERLAKQGALFKDCVGQASWTKVATPSLMTSLYPTSHGVRDFFDRLAGSATTLAEVYRTAGYATLSLSSILFTGKFTNLHQGFEVVHESGSLPNSETAKTARDFVDRLVPWLETHREVPFFVFLHVADPHDPFTPYAPYDTLWADPARREAHELQGKELLKIIADPLLRHMGSPMPTRDELTKARVDPSAYIAHNKDLYDGAIRGMDEELGRMLEALRGLGLDEKTLVVFTSDHGEEWLDHGRTFHGQSVYGEMNNMALILRGPGVPKGAVVDTTVQVIDIMPTLLELSGLEAPQGMQGSSLHALLEEASPDGAVAHAHGGAVHEWEDRPAVSEKLETDGGKAGGSPPPRDTESVALILGGYKLIHNVKRPAGAPEFELYDHSQDPLDQKDLAAARPDMVERLLKQLGKWKQRAAAARLKPDSAQGVSAEELEKLRALGYVQ